MKKGIAVLKQRRLGNLVISVCMILSASGVFASEEGVDLGNIVVTPSRIGEAYRYATQDINVVDEGQIAQSGAHDSTEILGTLPSVDVLGYGGLGSTQSIQIRGATSSQVLTLIDGRPVNSPRDAMTDFNQIPLSNIERIEVLRGPASSMYGSSAVGGVVNIITKSGKEKMETSFSNIAGSFDTRITSFTHGYKVNNVDYFISWDNISSEGIRANADYKSNNVATKVGYQFDPDNHIGIASGYYNARAGTPGLLSNEDLNDRQNTAKDYIDLTYTGKILEDQDILIKLFRNRDRLEFIETQDPLDKTSHQTWVYGLDAQVSQRISEMLRLALGITGQDSTIDSTSSGKHEYNLKGAYVDSEFSWEDILVFKLGARWDDYSNFGDRISPSASLAVWLSKRLKLHALVGQSFRAPTFNDLYWPREDGGIWGGVEGNPHLGPEKATSFEAGFSLYYKRLTADITLFKTNYRDLIEWASDATEWWRPENVSAATIQGVDINTEYRIADPLKVNFNYTYTESQNRHTKKWLIYRPRHLYKLGVAYAPVEKLKLGMNAIYKTKRFHDKENTVFLKQYAVVNFDCSYAVRPSFEIVFEVKNLFDRTYQEERDYPLPGRAFYGGIRTRF